ncbi:MAG: hypothetical protein OEV66_06915, partial [Spirochaetia bacterium]|nr:hypothetical protein [Spirochaetia bacterium]
MKKFNIFLLIIYIFSISFTDKLYSQKKTAKAQNNKEKKEPRKEDPKLNIVERMRLVFKFGNVSQVKESLDKIKTLKEDEQKSLIPDIKLLFDSTDPLIQKAVIQAVADVTWSDLDESIIKFLDSENMLIVATAANAIHRKKITEAIAPLVEKLRKIDYTQSDTYVNDFISAYSGFKDSTLKDFMFEKLRDEKVLNNYKTFMIKYLGTLDNAQDEIKKYLLEVSGNEKEDLNLRVYSVRALGNMKYMEARDPFKKHLNAIDSLTENDKKREV